MQDEHGAFRRAPSANSADCVPILRPRHPIGHELSRSALVRAVNFHRCHVPSVESHLLGMQRRESVASPGGDADAHQPHVKNASVGAKPALQAAEPGRRNGEISPGAGVAADRQLGLSPGTVKHRWLKKSRQ